MSKKQKRELKRIIISSMFFVTAFFVEGIKLGVLPVSYILSACAFLVCGWQSIVRAVKNLVRLNPLDEHFLMTVASLGAFAIGEPIEGAAVMVFYRIGELFQGIAVSKSRKSIASLADIAPEFAGVLRDGEYIEVLPEEVANGDILLIKAGEKVPVDCCVNDGISTVDTKAVTGESMPVSVSAGSKIISGSVNLSGVLYCTAEATYKNSTVAKILELTENMSSRKSKYESFIHRFALIYTPVVVGLAVLLAVVPSIIFKNPLEWIRRALTFLVISCPCALVISVPLAFFAGLGKASKNGILIKGSNFLESLAKADTAVFDKTGTLTTGDFSVLEAMPNNIEREALMQIAASLESYSNHPVAEAIVKEFSGERVTLKNYKELSGLGVYAESENGVVLAGNKKLLEKYGVECCEEETNGTTVFIAQNGVFLGSIRVGDTIKPNAQKALNSLRAAGVKKTIILTGDRHISAERVKKSVGADEVRYELLPQQKVEEAKKIMEKSKSMIFAGDGINDAPVMTMADIAISMGKLGQDAAIEASDVVITDDNLEKISQAIKISRQTVGVAKANIIFSIGIKAAVLILGAAGWASVWAAVFADVGVCVIAILNSMRLLKKS